MARVTASKVKQIISTDILDADVDVFIESANVLVTKVIGSNTSLSDDLKTTIELWLSAHLMASTRVQQLKSGEAGGAKAVYQGVTAKGLESTLYGQQVMVLDASGSFAALGGKSATITAITSFD